MHLFLKRSQGYGLLLLSVMMLFLAGCSLIQTQAVAVVEPERPTLLPTPTLVVAVEEETAISNEPADSVNVEETAVESVPLAGLVYPVDGAVWMMGKDGNPIYLTDKTDPLYLADGQSFLFTDDQYGDIFLYDNLTGEEHNLTNTPNQYERGYQWLSDETTDVVVFNYIPEDQLGPWAGYLAAMRLDGSDYRVIDGEVGSNTVAAIAPDGRFIIYMQGNEPWLYDWQTDSAAPMNIDLTTWNLDSMGNPAWSPDGQKIAWSVGGYWSESGNPHLGTFVYDLASETGQLLHTYELFAGGGWTRDIEWSPDSQWLAILTPGDATDGVQAGRAGSWVIAADGVDGYYLGQSGNYVWKPDGSQLAFYRWHPEENTHDLRLLTVGTWEEVAVTLPDVEGFVWLMDWRE